MYMETRSNNSGSDKVFCSFARTDSINIFLITFYYHTFSIVTDGSLKLMGPFRIELLLENGTWRTRYNKPKNDRYSDSITDWTLYSYNFTVENYGIKLKNDQIDSPQADMSFSNFSITHSVY